MQLDAETKKSYFRFFYANPLLRYVQNWGHVAAEKFVPSPALILDLGAGTCAHAAFVKPDSTYVALDEDLEVLQIARRERACDTLVRAEASCLPFADNTFGAIVSVYSFEHFAELGTCVNEAVRVLRPDGVLAAAIPTEGALFSLGRRLVVAPFAVKRMGFETAREYEAFVRRHHVNTLDEVLKAICNRFQVVEKRWFPFMLPSKNANLCVALRAVPRPSREPLNEA